MFGEIIAIWYITALEKYRNLKHVNFVEVGPGKGTLLCDMIRAFANVKMLSNMTFYLVEISESLIVEQRDSIIATLKNQGIYVSIDLETKDLFEDSLNLKFKWSDKIETIRNEALTELGKEATEAKSHFTLMKRFLGNERPYFILAHEFFDAIPVYQFIYDEAVGWRERLVSIDRTNKKEIEITESILTTENVKKLLQPEKTFNTKEMQDKLRTGDMIEISPHSQSLVTDMAELISATKGQGLIIDYGEDQALSNSIRAIKNHKYLSENEMMRTPGKADVSAYVNFRALKYTAEKVKGVFTRGPMPQGLFLESMGMNIRKEALRQSIKDKSNSKDISQRLEQDYVRLVHPDQMGEIYKVLHIGNEHVGEVYPFLKDELEKTVEYE
jgi:NADH dehydrogenase [ubiquinone] 1 alpha subcomplex assembly factor 7